VQTLLVNDYDIAWLDIGQGRLLVCRHGRTTAPGRWCYAPDQKSIGSGRQPQEHWDGIGDNGLMTQPMIDLRFRPETSPW
jgi:hypothetical protein